MRSKRLAGLEFVRVEDWYVSMYKGVHLHLQYYNRLWNVEFGYSMTSDYEAEYAVEVAIEMIDDGDYIGPPDGSRK